MLYLPSHGALPPGADAFEPYLEVRRSPRLQRQALAREAALAAGPIPFGLTSPLAPRHGLLGLESPLAPRMLAGLNSPAIGSSLRLAASPRTPHFYRQPFDRLEADPFGSH